MRTACLLASGSLGWKREAARAASSQVPSSSACALHSPRRPPGPALPPAVPPAYLRPGAAGRRRHRSAPPADAPGAGCSPGSGSGGSRAPPRAIAPPAEEAARGPLAARPARATAAATDGAHSPRSWRSPRLRWGRGPQSGPGILRHGVGGARDRKRRRGGLGPSWGGFQESRTGVALPLSVLGRACLKS